MKHSGSTTALGHLLRIQNGCAFSSKEFDAQNGMPLIRIRDLKNGVSTETRYRGEYEPRYVVKAGDFLIGMDGEFGCFEWRGEPALLNQRVCRLEGYSNNLVPRFLFYGLNAHLKKIEEATSFTTVKHLSSKQILDIEFPTPPLSEQQRIVSVLDEAFVGLEAMRANAEKNLQNARELFEDYLKSVFANNSTYESKAPSAKHAKRRVVQTLNEAATRTGGRAATTRYIAGDFSLCVGMPKEAARQGWQWRALTDLARMESGHTPSRRHPEYWGGDVPWIGIRDAKRYHGAEITETEESTNLLGLANSSARLLPTGTVCLSRTASVGYVTIMPRPMATSQDFVNWVCGKELDPHFLSFLFLAQGEEFFKFSSGAVHQTIYFPEAKAFHVCIPSLEQQRGITEQAKKLKQAASDLEGVYARKLAAIDELKQSILQKAFAGEPTDAEAVAA